MKHAPAVLALFGRQYWVATSQQLDRAGMSRDARLRARRSGLLRQVERGVWHLTSGPFSWYSRLMVLVLVAGDGAALSHATAGKLWRLRRMPRSKPTICVPGERRLVVPEWGHVRYTNWPDPDPTVRLDGLVITSPLRTVFDLGALLSDWTFEHAAEDLWHKGLVTPATCHAFLQAVRRSGRRGVSRMEEWLEGAMQRPRPAQSGLEIDLARELERIGLPAPRRQVPLLLPTLGEVKVDLGWDVVRLGLEPGHSTFHEDAPEDVRYDEVRDEEAAELGWVILRYNERQLADLSGCARQIRNVFRERERAVRLGLL